MLAEAEEAEADLLGERYRLEGVADRLRGGAVAAVRRARRVAEGVDAELERLLVLGAVTWAIYALAQKQLLLKLPSSSIMLLIYGGCAILFTPLATPPAILSMNPLHFGMLLFCGLNTLLAYGAFAEALEHWEASRVSAAIALTPLVSLVAVWAVSILTPSLIPPEHLTALGVFGAILVVIGSAAIALGKNR